MPAVAQRTRDPSLSFPAIERCYRRPVGEWLHLVSSSPLERHAELVAMLRIEYGMRHGHADALVAFALRDRR